jgi:hypothetical protein
VLPRLTALIAVLALGYVASRTLPLANQPLAVVQLDVYALILDTFRVD